MATQEKTQYTQVEMTDGRIVQFAGKRRMLKETGLTDDGCIYLRIDFLNGETRTFLMNPKLKNDFAEHGMSQRYGDEVAGFEGDIEDLIVEIEALHSRFESSGEWTTRKEGTSQAGGGILLRALLEVTKKPREELVQWLAGKDNKQKKALSESDLLAPVIARLKLESGKTQTKIDTSTLFAEIGV